MKIGFKNTFGAQTSATSLDLQRVDLWKVNIMLPQVLGFNWTSDVQFLVEKFPFPSREREMIEVKYMQQTNFLIGKDAATSSVEIPVRYAFNTNAAAALERWFWLVSNPMTGGVGLTSQVKAKGWISWYTPNMQKMIQDMSNTAQQSDTTMDRGLTYVLEGCIPKGLKFTDADQTQSAFVNVLFTLQVDRYYPEDINKMTTVPVLAVA